MVKLKVTSAKVTIVKHRSKSTQNILGLVDQQSKHFWLERSLENKMVNAGSYFLQPFSLSSGLSWN